MLNIIEKLEGKFEYRNFDDRVLCIKGNCADVMKLIDGKSIDLVLTDVPYIQEFHDRGMAKDRPNYKKISNYGSNKKRN